MLVSHRKEFIYTKTYKTASTSIELLFEPYCLPGGEAELSHERDEKVTKAGIVGCRGCDGKHAKWYNHMPAAKIRDKIENEIWKSYYKFCSIRNPFDKAVSMYNHVRSDYKNGYINGILRGKTASLSKTLLKKDFERFVKTFKSDRNKYSINEKFSLDGVIFFENLLEDVEKTIETVEVDAKIEEMPTIKSGNRINNYETHEYYSKNSKKYIEKEFSFEMEVFGYVFPGPGATSAPAEESRERFAPSVKKIS